MVEPIREVKICRLKFFLRPLKKEPEKLYPLNIFSINNLHTTPAFEVWKRSKLTANLYKKADSTSNLSDLVFD